MSKDIFAKILVLFDEIAPASFLFLSSQGWWCNVWKIDGLGVAFTWKHFWLFPQINENVAVLENEIWYNLRYNWEVKCTETKPASERPTFE